MDIKHIRVGEYYIVTNSPMADDDTYHIFPPGINGEKKWIARCLNIDIPEKSVLCEFTGNGKMIQGHSYEDRCWFKNPETVLRKADIYGKDKIWLYEI